jgi:hypothetical protein
MKLLLLTSLIFLISCSNLKTKDEVNRIEYINQLAKKIGVRDLPLTFDLIKGENSRYEIDKNSLDTLFFPSGSLIGVLPDTSNFYALVSYQVSDSFYPSISTFDKKGYLIDRINIGIGNCGGLLILIDSCTDRVVIKKNFEIEADFQVSGEAENPKTSESIRVCNKITGSGKIHNDGKLEFQKSEIFDCLKKG